MDVERYRATFRGSPMKRAKLRGLKRNAVVVLGNVGSPEDAPSLVPALSDSESLVRAHAAWALRSLASPAARGALRARVSAEADLLGLESITAALSRADD